MKLCIGDLAEIIGGQLVLASLPPLAGPYEPVRRIVVESREVRPGTCIGALPPQAMTVRTWPRTPICAERSGLSSVAAISSRGPADSAFWFPTRIRHWSNLLSACRAAGELQRRKGTAVDKHTTGAADAGGDAVTLENILTRLSENAGQFVA